MKSLLKSCTALVAAGTVLMQPVVGFAQTSALVTAQPNPTADVSPYYIDPAQDPMLSTAQMAALMRAKIKYVFVIFNENRSFDNEYGTFPGANGIYSSGGANPVARSAANTPGFTQTYKDVNGNTHTVQPFLIGPTYNSTFVDSVDHSHTGLAAKIDVVNGTAQMDGFSQDEYNAHAGTSPSASTNAQAQGTEYANLVMSHIDCNTIPFFWYYASRFALFDNIFATEDTPSSPNAIAMIAGQSGETQWVEHPGANGAAQPGFTGPYNRVIPTTSFSSTTGLYTTNNSNTYSGASGTTVGAPIVSDQQPFYGSEFDTTTSNPEPTAPKEGWAPTNIASNLTFASVPLTLMGSNVTANTNQDLNPSVDLADIKSDISYIQSKNTTPITWRWYQNGYDTEPNDSLNLADQPNIPHENYVSHHNGAQYFGYLANNSGQRQNFRGEGDFFTDMANNNLPSNGGVFYIRGGYFNIKGQTPPIQNANYPDPHGLTALEKQVINANKSGDDNHPSYTDDQLSESMAARVINAVASNPTIWSQSAIIITYDESDGYYDHVPPRILSYGPDHLPLARGIRIPLIVISPYARTHVVSHAEGDHNAVIETINTIYNLPPLSSLPAEAAALAAGNSSTFNQFGPAGFQQKYLGPRDTNSPTTDSLLSAFSPARLRGVTKPLPASLATIPSSTVESYPHYNGNGCSAIGITPFTGSATPPTGFNTLPGTLPAYNVIIN